MMSILMTGKQVRVVAMFCALTVAACGTTKNAVAPRSDLLRSVAQASADGKGAVLTEKQISVFQRLLRTRLASASELGKAEEVLALEINVADGEGNEGAYVAFVRWAGGHGVKKTELRYFEQKEHRPRADRYFHRELTADEANQVWGFVQGHPLTELRQGKVAPPAAGQGADRAEQNEQLPVQYRVTLGQAKGGETVTLESPTEKDRSAMELLGLVGKLRDARALACSYFQRIPPNAKLLYADPYRKVLRVWAQGDDIRAAISPPVHPLDAVAPPSATEHWLALKDGQWTPCEPPADVADTEQGTQPVTAAVPATAALVPQDAAVGGAEEATLNPATAPAVRGAIPSAAPSRFSNPGMLPEKEVWTTETHGAFTAVSHYMPNGATSGTWKEFWVPVFQFDDEHMWVDAPRNLLYVIHSGQLFAVPLPGGALSPQ